MADFHTTVLIQTEQLDIFFNECMLAIMFYSSCCLVTQPCVSVSHLLRFRGGLPVQKHSEISDNVAVCFLYYGSV